MIKILGHIPKDNFAVACSGGVDSMAVVDFLSKHRKFDVLFFNHNTKHSHESEKFIQEYCLEKGLNLITGKTDKIITSNREMTWRDLRYEFFNSYNNPIITCHHLNDVVETYVFYMIRGNDKLIPYKRNNIIRPFLLNKKEVFEEWCKNKNVPFIEDESNMDVNFSRNRIRHNILPEIEKINPGVYKVIKKKILDQFETFR